MSHKYVWSIIEASSSRYATKFSNALHTLMKVCFGSVREIADAAYLCSRSASITSLFGL